VWGRVRGIEGKSFAKKEGDRKFIFSEEKDRDRMR